MTVCRVIFGKMSNLEPIHPLIMLPMQGVVRKPQLIRPHRHDHWQMQWVTGEWTLLSEEGERALTAEDLVILPPGTLHGFHHHGGGEAFFAIMFHFSKVETPSMPLIAARSPLLAAWKRCAEALMKDSPPALINSLLASLTAVLLPLVLENQQPSRRMPPCVVQAKGFIDRNLRRSVTVQEAARSAGVTRGYLSTLFRETTGESAKEYVDRRRVEASQEMLRYSDLSISQIADQLGFGDVFSFSRFFKNRVGCSPKHYRLPNA